MSLAPPSPGIAVVGPGAVGGSLGVLLARAGSVIRFIARPGTAAHLRAGRLCLERPAGSEYFLAPNVVDDPRTLGPCDVILFSVKGPDTERAAARIAPLIGPESLVLCLQNGVAASERLRLALPGARVIAGVVWLNGQRGADGVIRLTTADAPRIAFGAPDGCPCPRLSALRDLMARAGIAAELHPDIRRLVWHTALLRTPLSAATACLRQDLGGVRAHPEGVHLLEAVLVEVGGLARALKLGLPYEAEEAARAALHALPDATVGSMLGDLRRGRPLESAETFGALLALAGSVGHDAPVLARVERRLAPFARGRH